MFYKWLKIILAACFALLFLYFYQLKAFGFQEQTELRQFFQSSSFEVTHPLEFPGVVLAKGSYSLELRRAEGARYFIRLLNQDSKTVAVLMAMKDYRLKPNGGEILTYHLMPEEEPWPVRSWQYQNNPEGFEFVYEKKRAREIAKLSDDLVLASDNGISGTIVAITPNDQAIVMDKPKPNKKP